MEFVTAPPEVTSALIHSGPGAQSLVEASAAWQHLGAHLEESAENYAAAVSSLTSAWHGPSSTAMIGAVEPYLGWLRTTAQQCRQLSSSAQAAATAYTSVRAAVVPTAQVSANRTRLAELLATNRFGTNLPAIAETEDHYQAMWANNSAAIIRYQAASAQATALPQFASPPSVTDFDPNSGWFGLANTYANQFISSGFPINLLSYLAQNTSAQALQGMGSEIGQGLAEGEAALVPSLGALGAAGLSAEPTAAIGVGVSMGKLTAPPAVVGLLPASQAPVQLASAVSPLPAGESGLSMLPPIMPPPVSAGSGWRKRKQQKYDDLEYGLELKGTVIHRPPSAG
ncbi:PPE family protein [Mycobacterium celatum]|uniref:PPE family protein n=1 Tax=Mycobacterium celatum TaxID=28045 RepID=A0A1X1RS64_MYCCE|nr:PPE family protein [Mycobacterium celatum]ORV14618.1 hypothetical protein AWB95_08255 [Mycobacterium celatum]PIB78033.1 PPE family protein [Mycobacterium celatum]